MPGLEGDVPNIIVGSVDTLKPGDDAMVAIDGDRLNCVLHFAIPRGKKGDKGDKGDKGADGITPDLSSYQKRNDESLETFSKNIIGAINELLDEINSLKEKIKTLEPTKE